MTTQELIDYYTNLLIIQYAGKPRARAHIALLADFAIMDQLPLAAQEAFTLGSAKGAQLDVIGKYAGVSRTGYTFSGQVTLNDQEFTTLIQLAIVKNNSGSSLYEIQNLLKTYFPGNIRVFDFKQMRMGYYVSSNIASQNLAQMFLVQGLLPVPMGIQLASTIYYPVLDQFFGFCTYTIPAYNNTPFNQYVPYQTNWPWLSYSYEIGSPSTFDEGLSTEDGSGRIVQEDGSLIFI